MHNKTDEAINTIHEGQAARMIRGQTEDYLIEREEAILTRLVNGYKQDTLTNDAMRGSIGEIAGLRDFRLELESKIRKGIMTAEQELAQDE